MSFLDDLGDAAVNVLRVGAPTIGTMLGGPLGGMAVKALVDNLLPASNTPATDRGKELSQALIGMTPDALANLKKLDQDFAVQMKKIDVDLEKLANDDRNSARQREISLRDWAPSALAIVVTVGFFGALYVLSRYDLPAGNKDYLIAAMGALGMAWGNVISYYFGSSSGSARKTELLSDAKKS